MLDWGSMHVKQQHQRRRQQRKKAFQQHHIQCHLDSGDIFLSCSHFHHFCRRRFFFSRILSLSFRHSLRINMRIGIFFYSLLTLFATFVLVSHVRQICALFLFACASAVLLRWSSLPLLPPLSSPLFSLSIRWIVCVHHIIWCEFRCKTSVE